MSSIGPNYVGTGGSSQISGTWATLSNAEGSGATTYTTWTSTSSGATATWQGTTFGLAGVPDNAVINSISVSVRHYENNTTYISALTGQVYVGGTAIGSPYTFTRATSARTDTWTNSGTFYGSNIANLQVRVIATHNASTSSAVEYIDWATITVTYTTCSPSVVAATAYVQQPGTQYYDAVIAASSPRAYWRLDEPPNSSTVADSSGNGNTGTPTNGPTLGKTDYPIAGSDQPACAFVQGSLTNIASTYREAYTALTAEAWVNLESNSLSGYPRIIASDAGSAMGFVLCMNSGKLFTQCHPGSATVTTTAGSALPITGWHHVVMRYNGSEVCTWTDGVKDTGAVAASGTIAIPTSYYTTIGKNPASSTTSEAWTGEIARVAVYNTALSDATIIAHYQAGIGQATISPTGLSATASIPATSFFASAIVIGGYWDVYEDIYRPDIFVSATTTIPTPTVTTGASAGATATPSVVSATASIPSVVMSALANPGVVSATASVPAPAMSQTVKPAVVSATSTVNTVVMSALANPGVVSATASVGTAVLSSLAKPGVVSATAALGSLVMSSLSKPSVLAGTSTVPSPTAVSTGCLVIPSVIAASCTIPAPTAVKTSVTISPTVLSATASVPGPVVTASGNVTVSPACVSATASIPAVVMSSLVAPSVIASTSTVPAPTAVLASVTVKPTVLSATASVPAPTVATSANALVTPACLACSASIGSAQPRCDALATPVCVSSLVNIPALTMAARALPAVVSATASVPVPVVVLPALVTPAVVSATASVGTLTVHLSATVQPDTVQAVAVMDAPTVPNQFGYGTLSVSGGSKEYTSIEEDKSTLITGEGKEPNASTSTGEAPDIDISGETLGSC